MAADAGAVDGGAGVGAVEEKAERRQAAVRVRASLAAR